MLGYKSNHVWGDLVRHILVDIHEDHLKLMALVTLDKHDTHDIHHVQKINLALYHAIIKSKYKLADYLLEIGADINISITENKKDKKDLLELILSDYGAYNYTRNFIITALKYIFSKGFIIKKVPSIFYRNCTLEVLDILLDNGLDVNKPLNNVHPIEEFIKRNNDQEIRRINRCYFIILKGINIDIDVLRKRNNNKNEQKRAKRESYIRTVEIAQKFLSKFPSEIQRLISSYMYDKNDYMYN